MSYLDLTDDIIKFNVLINIKNVSDLNNLQLLLKYKFDDNMFNMLIKKLYPILYQDIKDTLNSEENITWKDIYTNMLLIRDDNKAIKLNSKKSMFNNHVNL